jgi:hypothetical protein
MTRDNSFNHEGCSFVVCSSISSGATYSIFLWKGRPYSESPSNRIPNIEAADSAIQIASAVPTKIAVELVDWVKDASLY